MPPLQRGIQVAPDQSHIVILRKPGYDDRIGMVDHERTGLQDVFVRHHHALGLHRRPRRVLEKQNLRSVEKGFVRNRIDEVFRDDPRKTGDVVDVDAGRRDSTSGEIRLQRCVVVLCWLKSRPPGNPWRCGPSCTGRSGSRENWEDRRAQGSIRRARNQKTRRSSRAPAGRRAEAGPPARNDLPSASARRSPSSARINDA